MARRLLRIDGSFTTGARAALVLLVAGGFAVGFLARGGGADSGAPHAVPVAQGRIEADLPALPSRSGPALASAAALPSLAAAPRRARRARPAATPEPVATPAATPSPTATPVATSAPPVPVPVSAPAPAPRPKPTPESTTFDSSG